MNIDVPSFETFLVLHTDTLSELQLCYVKLTSTSNEAHIWVNFLKFMKRELHISFLSVGGEVQEGHPNEITFDPCFPYRLRSWEMVDWCFLALFLVCDQYPWSSIGYDYTEFSDVSWEDLNYIYY